MAYGWLNGAAVILMATGVSLIHLRRRVFGAKGLRKETPEYKEILITPTHLRNALPTESQLESWFDELNARMQACDSGAVAKGFSLDVYIEDLSQKDGSATLWGDAKRGAMRVAMTLRDGNEQERFLDDFTERDADDVEASSHSALGRVQPFYAEYPKWKECVMRAYEPIANTKRQSLNVTITNNYSLEEQVLFVEFTYIADRELYGYTVQFSPAEARDPKRKQLPVSADPI